MSEWLSYATQIDGKPAIVDFDADLDEDAGRAARPYAIELTVRGFPLDGQRLPTDDADDALYALEAQLEGILAQRDGALAAMFASDGWYRYLAYDANGGAAPELEAAARQARLEPAVASRSDAGWEGYARWALSGEDLESARDRAQIEELQSIGEDLVRPRDVTFDYEFDDATSAAGAVDAFEQAGFSVPEYDAADAGIDEIVLPSTIGVSLNPQAVGVARRRATAIAAKFGGRYLGWGCELEAEV